MNNIQHSDFKYEYQKIQYLSKLIHKNIDVNENFKLLMEKAIALNNLTKKGFEFVQNENLVLVDEILYKLTRCYKLSVSQLKEVAILSDNFHDNMLSAILRISL